MKDLTKQQYEYKPICSRTESTVIEFSDEIKVDARYSFNSVLVEDLEFQNS